MKKRIIIDYSKLIDYSRLTKGKDGKVTVNGIMDFLLYCCDKNRWEAFYSLLENDELRSKYPLNKYAFYRGFDFAYTCGRANRFEAYQILEDIAIWNEWCHYTTKNNRDFYKQLPDIVELYRGCSKWEYDSSNILFSWTTDRGIAEFFAFRYSQENRIVLKTKVKKERICCAFQDRDEKECVLIDLQPSDVEIVTNSPTSFYTEYINNRKQ